MELQKFDELGLNPDVLKAVLEQGYVEPTEIQEKAIPHILAGKDVLGIAQTGTGKTASFTLPMLTRLTSGRARAKMPRSLILSPTRELAAQTARNFDNYGKYVNISMALLIGGVGLGDQEKTLEKGVDVLIATPGRLLDWFERGKILLGGVEMMVIDEADRMLDMGFIPDVERIIQLITKKRQTLLLSATMPAEIRNLAAKFLTDPEEITIKTKADKKPLIDDKIVPLAPGGSKRKILHRLIKEERLSKAICFCNRKRDVGIYARFLQKCGYASRDIHGDLEQSHRNATLKAFADGNIDFLIATDVAARGIDINDMPAVVNIDVPMNADDYVHRIGRTGRAGQKGRAFTIVGRTEKKFLSAIEKLVGRQIEVHALEEDEPERPLADKRPSSERPEKKRAAKTGRGSDDGKKAAGRRKEPEIVGMGDHVPAFLLRTVPIKTATK